MSDERIQQALRRLRENVYLFHAYPRRIAPAKYEDLITVKLAYMAEHPEPKAPGPKAPEKSGS